MRRVLEMTTTWEGLPEELLTLYGIKPLACYKRENVWTVQGEEATYLISECRTDPARWEEGLNWQEFLTSRGFSGVPRLLKNSLGLFTAKLNDILFRIEAYPPGEPFNGNMEEHLLLVAEGLGKMHALSREYSIKASDNRANNAWAQYTKRLTELLSFFTVLRQERARNDFERLYVESFDFLYSQGQEALQKMTMAKCRIEAAEKNEIMLVNSFTAAELKICEQQAIFLNLREWDIGLNVSDLALFINCYLPLHKWDRELLGRILAKYGQNRALSSCEKNFLVAHLRFPNRYWFYTYQYVNAIKSVTELASLLKSYLYECYRRDRCLDSLSAWLWEEEK